MSTVPSTSILYWRIRNGESIKDSECWIGSKNEQIDQVVAALSHPDCATTELDLSGKGFGDQGATALAEALKLNKTLTTLSLSANSFRIEGATALAEALKLNKSLTTLDLHFNNISNEGAAAIAKALKSNKSLTALCLPFNNIGDKGAAALAEALKLNKSLTTLNLYGNNIGIEGASFSIEQSISRNKYLARLDPLLTQFASLPSYCEIFDVLYANNDNLSIIYDLLKGRNDWLSRGVGRKRKACTDLDESH